MTTAQDVLLPDIGDFSDVEVIEILVQPGDQISVDQSLITLESDKATMEIPSPLAGEVVSVAVAVGDKLSQGDPVLTLAPQAPAAEAQAAALAAAPEETPAETPKETPAKLESTPAPVTEPEAASPRPGEAERRRAPVPTRPEDLAAIAKGRKPHASPAVRRFARELGVDLTLVEGSGPKQRILKTDVQDYVKKTLARGAAAPEAGLPFRLPPAPEIDYAKFGEVALVPLPRIKKISGSRLHLNWISAPQVTQHDAADITDLEAFRASRREAAAEEGVKLTFLPILMKAVAKALDRFPNLKASLTGDGERLVLKGFTHLGVAVDTPDGLVVPVIRDVDKKGIYVLARELTEASAKARDGKLLPGDMQGGCFTISSLGGIGGTAFTPIVNVPEVAILGVSRTEMKPVWNGKDFIPRRILPMSLSYDHRVIDGAEAVRFTGLLRELLEDIRSLLL
ncbi:dihydrolipoyllysine-residue acetyltransferase [Candidatus Thiosymbion oneisti]|uniref:dihydrolipoyllysine-residue acetyltransferase n=1 Tax=Candidatus Thiosymbion oneisti TaxID=589554 RepID=UPI000AD2D496|nr:dihydrolipoyllysine-residue acetyltransferase [Candidatus Thiosymbion oneisti]